MVGIRKVAGENLGVTFRVERGELVIARILHGGMVAQQGLLHVGDVIREVNGREVGSDPRALQDSLRHASGSVVLKILPSYQEPHPPRQVFVKCHFDYDPASDSLIPCKEAGLRFAAGDLLQIVNQDDPNWWQVRGGARGGCSLSPYPGVPQQLGAAEARGGLGAGEGPCVEGSPHATLCPPNPRGAAWGGGPQAYGVPTCHAVSPSPRGAAQGGPRNLGSPHATLCLPTPGVQDEGVPMCHAVSPLPGVQHGGVPRDMGSPRATLSPQACHVEGGSAGLVPSQLLEEKRKAFVKRDVEVPPASGTVPTPPSPPPAMSPCRGAVPSLGSSVPVPSAGALCGSLSGKRKKRMMYLTTKNAEFDRHELLIYEEVARMPPFRRKTLVLIGAQGVGRRSLKNKLLMSDQARYGTTIPYTSRKPKESEKDGHGYRFVSRGEMEADIKAGRYLEHGEYEGNLYGTKIDSIRAVVDAGKMCILDVNPQAVKVLRTAEFVPYVVFIEAPGPDTLRAMNRAALESGVATKQLTEADARRTVEESSRIQRGYGHYFDLSLTNDDLECTFGRLRQAMERLRAEPQWVPVSWVY
uniref:Membrane palmitoylated protein 2 n=1 Tax=Anser cygnoides TaxID=8845 RepID=A0A8B9EKJ3_ANSCY